MTSNNQQAFLALVRAGLWEKEVRLSQFEEIDFSTVFNLAEQQAVTGLIAAGLEHLADVKVPQEILLTFVGRALQIEQRNKAMNSFLANLIEKLRKEDIYAILVKGQGIAQCYERPLWRASGDIDLLLDKENFKRAKEYLTQLASSVEKEITDELHLGLTIDPWEVELHGTLHSELSFSIDRHLDIIQNTVFSNGLVRIWRNGVVDIRLPRPDEDVVFVITHILQHFYKGGIGLRQVCDWSRLLWTYRDSLDVDLLENRLQRMKLLTEWKTFAALAVDYLGMPEQTMPFYSTSMRWKKKSEKVLDFVIETGNMGHNRDTSYYIKYPFIVRKLISFARRLGDLFRHSRLFPLDSMRFFPSLMFTGIRSAVKLR